MALWTMTPDGERVLVVPAHRAYAAAMTEDDPFTTEESARLKAALRREGSHNMGRPVHYGPGKAPLCGEEPVGTYSERLAGVGCRLRRLPGAGSRGFGRQQRLPGPLSPLPGAYHCQGRRRVAPGGPAVRAHIAGSRAGDALVCADPAELQLSASSVPSSPLS